LKLAAHAAVIRNLGKRVVRDVIEIGRRLAECKQLIGHGGWLLWLEREFRWSEQTARNYIALHELAAKSPTVVDLDLPMRGLYLLAAPSTPEEARAAVIERAENGDAVPLAEIKRVIEDARSRAKPDDDQHGDDELASDEEPEVTVEPCDDDQTIWRRGLMHRARSAICGAGFEDWRQHTADDEVCKTARAAADAWRKVADYLEKLRDQRAAFDRAALNRGKPN
jgi:hypothetical protein